MSNVIEHASGIRITLPFDYEAPAAPSTRRGGGRGDRYAPRPLPSAALVSGDDGAEASAVAAAFEEQGFAVTSLDLPAARPPMTRRGPSPAGPQTVAVDVPLGGDEEAVVLVEQEGIYAWKLPDAPPAPAGPRRRSGGTGPREVRFTIELSPAAGGPPERATRGFIKDLVLDKILDKAKLYVLRFVAKKAAAKAMSTLEQHVRPGLLVMDGDDPTQWRRLDGLVELGLPADRPARLLLFIHGTFSSTAGAYGALVVYPWGQHLLREAERTYDAVLGFDHPTLSVDPKTNAEDLLRRLRTVGEHPPHVDVVTHSRGGLVYRSLAELVLPGEAWRPTFGRVVFVGTPNAGTGLADPENWHTFVDLYTNIAVGVFRAVSLVPAATFVATLLKELVRGLGALMKYLATEVVTEGAVPGLAAMQPDGPFLRRLNEVQSGQPTHDWTSYCAITSNFHAQLTGDHEPHELPARLLAALGDRVTDALFRDESDLVVNTASMTAIDVDAGRFVKDHLDLGKNPHVYHTNYFTRPEVVAALARWLALPAPPLMASAPRRRSSSRGATRDLPVAVNTAILTTTSDTTAGELLGQLDAEQPDFVVVRRGYGDRVLNYAYTAEEVRAMAGDAPPDAVLLDALGMHEYQESPSARAGRALPAVPDYTAGPTTGRVVVLDEGRPVGVLAERPVALSSRELAERAAPPSMAGSAPPPSPAPPADGTRRVPRRTRSRGGSHETRSGTAYPQQQQQQPSAEYEEAGAEPSAQPPIACHFYAETPQRVQAGHDATLLVAVAREAIAVAAGQATASGQSDDVDPERPIILDVRPRRGFEAVGDLRATIEPPGPNDPVELYFDLRAVDVGEGEVHVTARQGQVPLVKLKLLVEITADVSDDGARPVRAEGVGVSATPLAEPLNQLRIDERDVGGESYYEFDLEIPGAVLKRFVSAPLKMDRQQYVDNLYREIEDRWLGGGQDLDDFTEELRALGVSLFTRLFPDELQGLLWKYRDRLGSIQVLSTEPFIPWELVHLKAPGAPGLPDETLFLAQFGLVRWLHDGLPSYIEGWPPEALRLRPGRARFVIPDYPHPDDVLPEAQAEAGFLEDAFGAERVEAQQQAVRKLLRTPGAFDLLHFACHGEAEHDNITLASLKLEGRVENGAVIPAYLSATTVAEHGNLVSEDGNRPLVVVNACQAGRLGFSLTKIGGFAQAFLQAGAGAFVGTLWSVGDAPARAFTEALYDALNAGDTLAEATRKAREKARFEDASWLAYAVYGHPHAALRQGGP